MSDTENIKSALESAYANLENNKELLNSLNVFPVPDGDTGSNMCSTFLAGLEKISRREYDGASDMLSDFSLACLMGARGNSGVILSLAVKGFTCEKNTVFDGAYLSKSLKNAVELCYSGVSSPKEGTALTLLRACADKAEKSVRNCNDFKKVIAQICDTAKITVEKTKELLFELKSADVVDAGAMGLMLIFDGIRHFSFGEPYRRNGTSTEQSKKTQVTANIKNKFCCEFVIKSENAVSLSHAEKLGDSIITACTDGITKFHIHSNFPKKALELAVSKGELVNAKIENMQFQYNSISQPKKRFSFVAVSTGEGFTDIFEKSGCDKVIFSREKVTSGQVISAVDSLNAETVFLFPNDKNNFLAFSQAAETSKKNCIIIKSSDPAECLEAIIAFDPNLSESENTKNMNSATDLARTGKVCAAVKDFENVKKGNIIGIIGEKIAVCEKNISVCVEKVIEKLCDTDYNSISIFGGESANMQTLENIAEKLERTYPSAHITSVYGGQDIYDFILSVN